MRKLYTVIFLAALALLVGCETTTGYRKSAGGIYADYTLKNVTVKGDLVIGDLTDTGTTEQTGTAAGSANGNQLEGGVQ